MHESKRENGKRGRNFLVVSINREIQSSKNEDFAINQIENFPNTKKGATIGEIPEIGALAGVGFFWFYPLSGLPSHFLLSVSGKIERRENGKKKTYKLSECFRVVGLNERPFGGRIHSHQFFLLCCWHRWKFDLEIERRWRCLWKEMVRDAKARRGRANTAGEEKFLSFHFHGCVRLPIL